VYEDGVPTGPLQQGDIIRAIPVPYLQDANEKIVFLGAKTDPKEWSDLEATPPKSAVCDDPRNKAIFVPTRTSNLLILSQCCDLQDIERGESGRIIVAPFIDDAEDPHITEHVQEKRAGIADEVGKKVFAAAVLGDQNAETAAKKVLGAVTRERDDYLKNVWLGQLEGTFPIAPAESGGFVLRRSICYFANLVSLPASWYPLLKERRMLRTKPHWRAILQESLAKYFSRFAYPGTNEERLRVGGIGAKETTPKDTAAKDAATTKE
jgi:hypothetical protein